MRDGRTVVEADALHEALDSIRAEEAHQLVFEGEVKSRRAGVALTPGAPAQLVVNSARLVALGADDVQAAGFRHALAEHDVRAAAGHVRRDRHLPVPPGVRHYLRLALVMLRVQNVV